MNQIISYNIERARRQAREIEESIAWAEEQGLFDLPDGLVRDAYVAEGLAIRIAPGKENFKQLRKAIGKGWKRHGQHSNNDGDVFINYFRPGVEWAGFTPHLLVVIDAAYADGVVCKIEIVGTETVDIRRVVCS